MNFFRSILADDSDPPESGNSVKGSVDSTALVSETAGGEVSVSHTDNAWSFGGMLKNLAARSESVIETYRKDLEEFGSGLKKETEIIRVVASRAVKDLPASLEAGASVAHGVFDGVLKSTAEIISREMGSDGETDTPGKNGGMNSGRYSRFEAQLSALQGDLNTFCEDPADLAEFENWRLKFQVEEKGDEIDFLIVKSGTLDGIYNKVVPSMVDRETFWCRYFYRVDKLKQPEKIRESLVKRAMSGEEDDDELSWDVDDEEDGHGINQDVLLKMNTSGGDRDTRVTDESLLLAENQGALKEKLDGVKEETVVETETSVGSGVVEVVDESSTLSDGPNHLNAKLHEEKEGAIVLKDDHSKNETVVSSGTDATLDDGVKNRNIDANNESRGDVLQDKKEDESPVKKGSAENSDNVVEEKRMQTIDSKEERENGSNHKERRIQMS